MEDQKGDTLFTAKRIACGFDFLPFFQKKFYFSSAQIYTFQLHLKKENESAPLNIQYIIDAFQSKDNEKKESFIDLSIKSLSLGHGIFSYRVENKISDEIKFNPNDILLT
ncbi:MAG: hypothetical protein LIO93_08110, partial [Bacteroidales bacterium]|nr:hypothetical protein [Bacteroidales bacterium]